MSLFEKFLLQAISAQRVLTLLSGMKRSPSPRPSPQGEGESCRRLGNAHCWEGPRVAVPVIRDGNMPSLPQGAVEMSSLSWVGERERVRAVHVLNCMDWVKAVSGENLRRPPAGGTPNIRPTLPRGDGRHED